MQQERVSDTFACVPEHAARYECPCSRGPSPFFSSRSPPPFPTFVPPLLLHLLYSLSSANNSSVQMVTPGRACRQTDNVL